jgi:hypothetical protein
MSLWHLQQQRYQLVAICLYTCSLSPFHTGPNCTHNCGAGSCLEPFKCLLCYPGTYANQTGSASCYPCDPGSFARFPVCLLSAFFCVSSKWHPVQGSPNCTACFEGTYSRSGSSMCTNCPAGYFASRQVLMHAKLLNDLMLHLYSPGSPECVACPPGDFSKEAAPMCLKCGQGM